MNTEDRIDDLIKERLRASAPNEAPARVLDGTMTRIAETQQRGRRWFGGTAGRLVAAAAVLLIAVVAGSQLAGVIIRPVGTSQTPLPSTTQEPAPSSAESVGPSPAVDPVDASIRVTCGGPSFPVELLGQPGSAEDDDDPIAEALRELMRNPEGADFLPATGWRIVSQDATNAYLITDAPPGSELPFVEAHIALDAGAWRGVGFGQCQPRADVGPDLHLAEFQLARGVELAPELVEIDVLVNELACTGGQGVEGRIVTPAVISTDDEVRVIFAVVPLPAGLYTCPGNPGTPYRLVLPEPLGDRVLVDGSTVPPRDVTICPPGEACP